MQTFIYSFTFSPIYSMCTTVVCCMHSVLYSQGKGNLEDTQGVTSGRLCLGDVGVL